MILRSNPRILSKTLKMLGLYFNTPLIGHTFCNVLSILNKLPLQKKLQTCVIKLCFRTKKPHQQQNKKQQHKNPWRSRELNPLTLAPKVDALPLHHRVN